MSPYAHEKQTRDELVATVLNTLPKISRAAIEARNQSVMMSTRRQRLADAIREAEMLAAFLRDRRAALGWIDPRSDAA